MSGRLDELRRQRELLGEHLAWLDREIAAQERGIAVPEPPIVVPERFDVTARDADRDAEAILAEFRRSGSSIENQTKRGCILYFAIGVGLLIAAALAAAYFIRRGAH